MVAVLIVAAGRGQRAGGGKPKQYRTLAGTPVLARSLIPFLEHTEVNTITVVIHPDDLPLYCDAIKAIADPGKKMMPPVNGGKTRQESVLAGLEVMSAAPPRIVLVHDAARPFCSKGIIDRAINAARQHGAAIPAMPVTDTIKRVSIAGAIIDTPDRSSLVAVQTPQSYDFAALLSAHRAAEKAGLSQFTDDAALIEWAGQKVMTFAGETENMKLTHESDFALAEARLAPAMVTRVGTGYDVHTFAAGDHIWLCGIRIPHDHGVEAHSDGDVALHALTDAVLGALADGDIGTHFPPSDPQWRGASSDQFLAYAIARLQARGGVIDHADLTLICEAPRIGPFREAMRGRIAAICDLPLSSVGLKATTSEGMGFTGRREGLAAVATATLRLPQGA